MTRSDPISVCVINYEGRTRLPEVIDALEASSRPIDELIVVDSASLDGSRELMELRYPHARLVALERNRGPAFARNRGYEEATHERIVFVDNDVLVQEQCVELLVQTLEERPEAVMSLPSVRLRAAPDVVQFEGAECHFLGLMSLRRAGEPADSPTADRVPVGGMVSACFAVHRGRMGPTPPFDESFGFNYEDHELGVRTRIAGREIVAVPGASCLHGDGTAGLSVRGDDESSPRRMYHLMRGRWIVLLKCFQIRTLIILSPALLAYEVAQLLFVVRHGLFVEWARAGRSLVAGVPRLWRERRSLQAQRALRDGLVLVSGPLPFRPGMARTRLERAGLTALEGACNLYWRAVRGLV